MARSNSSSTFKKKHALESILLSICALMLGACSTGHARYSSNNEGIASWYGRQFHNRKTASGERYNMYALTAAHRTLPFGSKVRVRNLKNGKSIVVRINDRGPYSRNRIIDLSFQAGKMLGIVRRGAVPVELEIISD